MLLFTILTSSLQKINATIRVNKDDIAMNLGVTKNQSNNNNPYIGQQTDHMAMMQETNQQKEYIPMEQYIAAIGQLKKSVLENKKLKKYLKVALKPVARADFVEFLARTFNTLIKHEIKPQSSYRENIDRSIAEALSKHINTYSNTAIDTLIGLEELKIPKTNPEYLFKGKNSYMHYAVKFGLKHCVKQLIVDGANINITNNNDTTPLHLAAFRGDKEIVELLIVAGADIDRLDNNWQTPLHFAVNKGHKEIVKLLIDQCADINIKTKNSTTSLHFAAYNRHKNIVQLLIDEGAYINIQNDDGNTPIHLAAYREYSEIVEMLLRSGADFDIPNNDGKPPFTWLPKNKRKKLNLYSKILNLN